MLYTLPFSVNGLYFTTFCEWFILYHFLWMLYTLPFSVNGLYFTIFCEWSIIYHFLWMVYTLPLFVRRLRHRGIYSDVQMIWHCSGCWFYWLLFHLWSGVGCIGQQRLQQSKQVILQLSEINNDQNRSYYHCLKSTMIKTVLPLSEINNDQNRSYYHCLKSTMIKTGHVTTVWNQQLQKSEQFRLWSGVGCIGQRQLQQSKQVILSLSEINNNQNRSYYHCLKSTTTSYNYTFKTVYITTVWNKQKFLTPYISIMFWGAFLAS
jgi:hypothetical protein